MSSEISSRNGVLGLDCSLSIFQLYDFNLNFCHIFLCFNFFLLLAQYIIGFLGNTIMGITVYVIHTSVQCVEFCLLIYAN